MARSCRLRGVDGLIAKFICSGFHLELAGTRWGETRDTASSVLVTDNLGLTALLPLPALREEMSALSSSCTRPAAAPSVLRGHSGTCTHTHSSSHLPNALKQVNLSAPKKRNKMGGVHCAATHSFQRCSTRGQGASQGCSHRAVLQLGEQMHLSRGLSQKSNGRKERGNSS